MMDDEEFLCDVDVVQMAFLHNIKKLTMKVR
jgi:hypothetical protein